MILRPKTLVIGGKTVPYGHAVIFGGWADKSKSYYWGLHESSSAKGAVRVETRIGDIGVLLRERVLRPTACRASTSGRASSRSSKAT